MTKDDELLTKFALIVGCSIAYYKQGSAGLEAFKSYLLQNKEGENDKITGFSVRFVENFKIFAERTFNS